MIDMDYLLHHANNRSIAGIEQNPRHSKNSDNDLMNLALDFNHGRRDSKSKRDTADSKTVPFQMDVSRFTEMQVIFERENEENSQMAAS